MSIDEHDVQEASHEEVFQLLAQKPSVKCVHAPFGFLCVLTLCRLVFKQPDLPSNMKRVILNRAADQVYGLVVAREGEKTRVSNLHAGSMAQAAGIHLGDEVIEVNGTAACR